MLINFKQAYDRIDRAEAMEEQAVNRKLIRLIKMALAKTEDAVRVAGRMSRIFEVREGLRQGDSLSPVLFNFDLEIRGSI